MTEFGGSTSATISLIVSKYDSVFVDKSSTTPSTWTYGTNDLLNDYAFFAQATGTAVVDVVAGNLGSGFSDNRALVFAISPNNDNDWDTTSGSETEIEINLGYETDGVALLKPYIDTTTFEAADILEDVV